MRRMEVACLPPCDQRQRGGVRGRGSTATGHAVRYALGALKGVGEKAMEQLVEERRAQRPVQVARRFRRAGRSAPAQPPPDREPRRRRRLRRARLQPRRGLRRRRDHPRPRRQRRRRARRAGRAACSASGESNVVPIRMPVGGDLDAGPAHGRGEGGVRLLFLGPSGRPLPPPRRGPWRAELSPSSGRAAGAGRRRPHRRGDGRAGRGGALAHLGARPALPDGDHVRCVGPVRRHRVRRRRSPRRSRTPPRPAPAPCSTSSSTAAPARRRRG